ncbi:hypothetical protein COA01_23055 [Bacillus cereus]|uniref:hypothetical protein n=1 Tax=Bacillus cereus TaxID=1396 RepID=UPI000BFBC416|nr:hypothetical protein [Bacillus cereus]PGP18624.1 hypothetical protein COA01_23055 [Bacillus cereus]
MVLEGVLNAGEVKDNFNELVDSVIQQKPIAMEQNGDIIWFFSQVMMKEMLSGYTLAIEYEKEEDDSFSGSLIPLGDIVVHGKTIEDMVEDAAIQLIEYAEDYYKEFNLYYNSPNRRPHLPYVLNILSQSDIEGVKKLINN